MKLEEEIIISLMLTAAVLLVWNGFILTNKGTACVQNPLMYGAKELKKSNGAEFSCSCLLLKQNSPRIIFDSTNFSVIFPERTPKEKINLSNFNYVFTNPNETNSKK